MKAERNGRKFGLTMAGVAVVFALLLLYKQRMNGAMILGAVAVAFALLALLLPKLLEPLEAVWMGFAGILGAINTRIILGVFYFLIFVPLGFIMRLFGRDTMKRRKLSGATTNWEDYRGRQSNEEHFDNMF
jgi:Saxitoxin biosynthesis operon protein SxtJ